jgi:large subunit ribosomal protein L10
LVKQRDIGLFALNCQWRLSIFYLFGQNMPITKLQKGQTLKDLEEKFSRAKVVYFAENKGLSVKDATNLRKKLHDEGVDFVVAKKTLMKLAAKNQNLPEITDETIPGPIAAVIGYAEDMILPSKLVKDFGDTVEKKVVLTGGIMDGKLLSKAEAIELASLPSKQQLLARLVGTMKAPLTGFYMVIKGLLEKSPTAATPVADVVPPVAEIATEAAPAV